MVAVSRYVRRVLGRVAEAPWHGAWRCWGTPWLMGGRQVSKHAREGRRGILLPRTVPPAGSAVGRLCRRPTLPSAVGSIGIEPTADGPWRRLSGAQLGPWTHPSGASRENGHGVACNRKDLPCYSRETSCSFQKFMDDSWEWNDFWHHPAEGTMSRIATGALVSRALVALALAPRARRGGWGSSLVLSARHAWRAPCRYIDPGLGVNYYY